MNGPAIFLCAIGVGVVSAAIPLALGRIPPNHWYGFRTPTTPSDPRVWHLVNRTTGHAFAVCGLAVLAVGLGMGLGALPSATHWILIAVAAPMLAAMVASAIGLDRALAQVERERSKKRSD